MIRFRASTVDYYIYGDATPRQLEALGHVPAPAESPEDPVFQQRVDSSHEGRWVPLCKRRLKISLREHPTLRDIEALKNLQIGNRIHNDNKNTDK